MYPFVFKYSTKGLKATSFFLFNPVAQSQLVCNTFFFNENYTAAPPAKLCNIKRVNCEVFGMQYMNSRATCTWSVLFRVWQCTEALAQEQSISTTHHHSIPYIANQQQQHSAFVVDVVVVVVVAQQLALNIALQCTIISPQNQHQQQSSIAFASYKPSERARQANKQKIQIWYETPFIRLTGKFTLT